MVKIQGQSGSSLADTYDVAGSVAEIEELVSEQVIVVHEMGATIFAERLRSEIRDLTSGAVAQNLGIDVIFADLPAVPWRILGVVVFVTADRVDHCSLNFRDPVAGREIPFWYWDSAVDRVDDVRFSEPAGGTADQLVLTPTNRPWSLPTFNTGDTPTQAVSQISLRGQTDGFGAGTVTTRALIYLAFPRAGGLSSRGLPVPSW